MTKIVRFLLISALILGTIFRCHNFLNKSIYSKPVTTLYIHPYLKSFIDLMQYRVQDRLPKVHADLLLGLTLGIDTIKEDYAFNEKLITTGLVHVVVVSGYNVGLVINFITSIFHDKLKARNRVRIFLFLTLYVAICGLQPPVIRAAVMGYIVYLASTQGRGLEGILLLVYTCLLMLIVYPAYILSLSFWLSTLATLGLMLFQKMIHEFLHSILFGLPSFVKKLPLEDLSTSLACQITVWPIIAHFFGRLSLASPLYNMLVLWLIPLCTILGFVYLLIVILFPYFTSVFMYVLLPFYDIFIRLVNFFDYIDRGNLHVSLSLQALIGYYGFVLAIVLLNSHTKNCTNSFNA